jgi:DnaJ-class molecular chaperone
MFTREMMKALEQDGDKLRQLTGEDHGPVFLAETRWVNCELCGGSGEVEVRPIVGPYEDPTPHGELCSACGGTGRDCVEVSPTECDDDQPHN